MRRAPLPAARLPHSLLVLLASLLVLAARPALAHEVGLSRGDYAASGAQVTAHLIFAQRDVLALVAGLDADHDGTLSTAEIAGDRDAIAGAIVGRVKVRGDDASCPGKLDDARLIEGDGVALDASYLCATPPRSIAIEVALLQDLPPAHRHLVRFAGATGPSEALLHPRNRSFSLESSPAQAASTAPPPSYQGQLSFFAMGIEHILTGYDHLVFLLGLVLVGGRARSLLLVVTAFTLAHSITLALATLGIWAPSPRIVEPAIALSIVYVGVENFFVEDAAQRWKLTFAFGLIHGFGFASALQAAQVPKSDVPFALLLFNLGVEAGQLAVLALLLPMIYAARRREAFRDRGVKLLSGAIAVAGAVWFVGRVVAAR